MVYIGDLIYPHVQYQPLFFCYVIIIHRHKKIAKNYYLKSKYRNEGRNYVLRSVRL